MVRSNAGCKGKMVLAVTVIHREGFLGTLTFGQRPEKGREGARWLSGNNTLGIGNSQGKGPEEGGPNWSVWGTFLGGWAE